MTAHLPLHRAARSSSTARTTASCTLAPVVTTPWLTRKTACVEPRDSASAFPSSGVSIRSAVSVKRGTSGGTKSVGGVREGQQRPARGGQRDGVVGVGMGDRADVGSRGEDLGVDRILDVAVALPLQHLAAGVDEDHVGVADLLEAQAAGLHPRAPTRRVAGGHVRPTRSRRGPRRRGSGSRATHHGAARGPPSAHPDAAVRVDHRPGDPARAIGREENVRARVVLGLERYLQRRMRAQVVLAAGPVVQGLVLQADAAQPAQLRAERAAGRHAVHPHARGQLVASCTTRPRSANFEATYSGPPRPGIEARGGDREHDAAAARRPARAARPSRQTGSCRRSPRTSPRRRRSRRSSGISSSGV